MTHLEKGDPAPLFTSVDHRGSEISLESLRGSKVVLYFYPKDNTPGCTAEACSLRDNYDDLLTAGFHVIGVSPDSIASHEKFGKKYELPFSLISDTEKEICNLYGVWGKKKFMGREYYGVHRTTFIIDNEGLIEEVISKVETKTHAIQILSINNKNK